MPAEIEVELRAEKKTMFAITRGKTITVDVSTTIVLMDGEIIVEHQTCGTCRPKTVILNKVGSHIILESDETYRLLNNTMKKADYLIVYPVINQSE